MFRDMTYSDATRLQLQAGEADVALQMDEDAFRAFYDRTSRGLWAYLTRLTGDRSAADDLLQESYYRFLRAGATHESEAHRRNSLFRIATNLARDARRRQLVRPIWHSHDAELVPSTATDVASAAETKTDLSRAMARLRPRERALLWLAYAQGSSHREIAETLGLQTGSVKLLLFRARRKLARFLGRSRDGGQS
jgi:RNA polymerase sigma-70 factor (ECF subfamily)